MGATKHQQFDLEFALETFNKNDLYVKQVGTIELTSGFQYMILSKKDFGWEKDFLSKKYSILRKFLKETPYFNLMYNYIKKRRTKLPKNNYINNSFKKDNISIDLVKNEIEKYDVSNDGIMTNQDFLNYF